MVWKQYYHICTVNLIKACACVSHMILIGHGLTFLDYLEYFGGILTFYKELATETRSKVTLTPHWRKYQ